MAVRTLFAILFIIWSAAAAVRLAAAVRMARNGLIRRYPMVVGALIFASLRSAALAWRFRSAEYALLLAVTEPFLLVLEGTAMISVFWVAVEKYPRFRTPGLIFLTALLGIGVLATWGTQGLPPLGDDFAAWRAGGLALLARRYAAGTMAVVIAGVALLLPRVENVPIRSSARRAAGIFALQVGFNLITSTISIWIGPRSFFPYFAPVVSGLIVSGLWLFLMTPASDVCGELVPATPEEQAEYKAILNVLGPGQSLTRYMRLSIVRALRSHAVMQRGEDHPST